jgi:hypothetical protein
VAGLQILRTVPLSKGVVGSSEQTVRTILRDGFNQLCLHLFVASEDS